VVVGAFWCVFDACCWLLLVGVGAFLVRLLVRVCCVFNAFLSISGQPTNRPTEPPFKSTIQTHNPKPSCNTTIQNYNVRPQRHHSRPQPPFKSTVQTHRPNPPIQATIQRQNSIFPKAENCTFNSAKSKKWHMQYCQTQNNSNNNNNNTNNNNNNNNNNNSNTWGLPERVLVTSAKPS